MMTKQFRELERQSEVLENSKVMKQLRELKCVDEMYYVGEVRLGDLVHAKALLGVTNGIYGFRLWEALTKALGKDGFADDVETLIEFRDKQKEALDYFFKPYYDKQQQEKEELHNLILAKQNELNQLVEKLNQM